MFEDYLILIMECTSLLFMLVLSFEEILTREKRELQDKLCSLCLFLTIIALMIEAESYAFDGNEALHGLTFTCNMLSFAIGSWIISAFMFYVTALFNEKQPTSFVHAKIVCVLAAVESALAIAGAFLGKTFTYIDSVYEPGPWLSGLSLFQMVFIVYLLVFVLANSKKLERRDTVTLLIYLFFTIATTLMEIIFEDLPSFYFVGQALAMDIIYVENRIHLRQDLNIQKEYRLRIAEQNAQLQQQQTQLKEALAMAQSANRAKTTFLNNMSHDIRTPMNAIIGYTGLAASHIDNKDLLQDYLKKIGQSSDHLLSLINDVLDMSRIESGKMNIDEKPENLPQIMHTLRNIVQSDINSKELDFFMDTADVTDENIICDKLRLNQVLLNVVSNAIKYTQPGGTVSLRIVQKSVSDNGYGEYEFRVKDNGIGISEEFLKTIFDPFTRVKSSTVSGIQGTGLGMAITRNIVDMMGGDIDITSKEGEGTEVVLNFKFRIGDAQRKLEIIAELEGLRGLVVDDDLNACSSISKMLKECGMRSEWCASGKEAVFRTEEAFRSGELYRVYIIDWLMPDMNGIETTRRIRRIVGNDAPIVILTSYDWSDIEQEAKEAGVTAFVSKPLFPSDLHSVLEQCLGMEAERETDAAADYDFVGKKLLLV